MKETYWCEHAFLTSGMQGDVRITVVDGRFSIIERGAPRGIGDHILGGVVLPGLANTHSHAFQRALRGHTQVGTGSFWTWRDHMYRAAVRLDPDSYHRLARATFGEMVSGGMTTVGEFHYVHHRPDGLPYANANAMGEAVLAAADDAGIRITMLDTLYLHGGLGPDGYMPVDDSQRRFSDHTASAWIERVDQLQLTGRAKLGAALHSVRAVDPEAMTQVADWARSRSCPIHIHLSEQTDENEQCLAHHRMTPTEVLLEAGALSADTTAVHATHLTSGDIAILGDGKAGVAMCPTTERDLADGIGPAATLAAAGVTLSLGSDSHAVIDLFEEARALELNERLASGVRGSFSNEDLVAAASDHGALGWHDAGKIEVGFRADLIAVDMHSLHTAGTPTDTAVMFSATAADVTDVVVDGARIVEHGHHRSLDVSAELKSSIEEIISK